MQQPKLRFIGVELYFDDLETARQFYRDTLHLEISNEQIGLDNDTTRAELSSFDQFLDSHPAVAKDLKQNPNLINNPQYLSKHPGLKDYLQDHPQVREELKENPGAFMSRERGLEGKEEKTEGKKHHKHHRNDETGTEIKDRN